MASAINKGFSVTSVSSSIEDETDVTETLKLGGFIVKEVSSKAASGFISHELEPNMPAIKFEDSKGGKEEVSQGQPSLEGSSESTLTTKPKKKKAYKKKNKDKSADIVKEVTSKPEQPSYQLNKGVKEVDLRKQSRTELRKALQAKYYRGNHNSASVRSRGCNKQPIGCHDFQLSVSNTLMSVQKLCHEMESATRESRFRTLTKIDEYRGGIFLQYIELLEKQQLEPNVIYAKTISGNLSQEGFIFHYYTHAAVYKLANYLTTSSHWLEWRLDKSKVINSELDLVEFKDTVSLITSTCDIANKFALFDMSAHANDEVRKTIKSYGLELGEIITVEETLHTSIVNFNKRMRLAIKEHLKGECYIGSAQSITCSFLTAVHNACGTDILNVTVSNMQSYWKEYPSNHSAKLYIQNNKALYFIAAFEFWLYCEEVNKISDAIDQLEQLDFDWETLLTTLFIIPLLYNLVIFYRESFSFEFIKSNQSYERMINSIAISLSETKNGFFYKLKCFVDTLPSNENEDLSFKMNKVFGSSSEELKETIKKDFIAFENDVHALYLAEANAKESYEKQLREELILMFNLDEISMGYLNSIFPLSVTTERIPLLQTKQNKSIREKLTGQSSDLLVDETQIDHSNLSDSTSEFALDEQLTRFLSSISKEFRLLEPYKLIEQIEHFKVGKDLTEFQQVELQLCVVECYFFKCIRELLEISKLNKSILSYSNWLDVGLKQAKSYNEKFLCSIKALPKRVISFKHFYSKLDDEFLSMESNLQKAKLGTTHELALSLSLLREQKELSLERVSFIEQISNQLEVIFQKRGEMIHEAKELSGGKFVTPPKLTQVEIDNAKLKLNELREGVGNLKSFTSKLTKLFDNLGKQK